MVEPLQAQDRESARTARLVADGPFLSGDEDLHGRQGFSAVRGMVPCRHGRQAGPRHLLRPSGRSVPDRKDRLSLPRPVAAAGRPERYGFLAAPYRRHFRRQRAQRRTVAHRVVPEEPGILQLLDQQHRVCRRFDRRRPHDRPDDGRQALYGRLYARGGADR